LEVDEINFYAKTCEKCIKCGEISRPNILMFGEDYFKNEITSKQHKNYRNWYYDLKKIKDLKLVIIEIGAGKTSF
jgi:NAD-dependent SIR2 family protein deacetylase